MKYFLTALLLGQFATAQVSAYRDVTCASVKAGNYNLVLVDAAIGQPTAMILTKFENNQWTKAFEGTVVSYEKETEFALPGHTYFGTAYNSDKSQKAHFLRNYEYNETTRTLKDSVNFQVSNLVDGMLLQTEQISFDCSRTFGH